MFWTIVSVVIILGLAWAMRKATINTPFDHQRACTPDIEHLRHLETDEPAVNKKNK